MYVVLILDDFVVMKVKPSDKGSKEGCIGNECMGPGNPFARK